MLTKKHYFFFSPGDKEEKGATEPTPPATPANEAPKHEEDKGGIPFIKKIKEALQEWSNDDEAQTEFDDTRV